MKRTPKTIVKCCPTCHRDGWEQREWFRLLTEEEQLAYGIDPANREITDAPPDAERCMASAGSSIHEAVREGIEIARELRRPVAFDFNGQTVVVRADSGADKVTRGWWLRQYKETPEESFAKR